MDDTEFRVLENHLACAAVVAVVDVVVVGSGLACSVKWGVNRLVFIPLCCFRIYDAVFHTPKGTKKIQNKACFTKKVSRNVYGHAEKDKKCDSDSPKNCYPPLFSLSRQGVKM